jgi:hypothetical protein
MTPPRLFTRRSRQAGTAGLEFALSTVFWVPLLLGTSVFGFNLIRAIQVTQVARDAAHMHAYGVDFSQTANKNLLLRLAQGMAMTINGGNGVVIFSTVMYVGNPQCLAAGLAANTGSCPNLNRTVFIRRIVVGNTALRVSDFGTPNAGIVNTEGHIVAPDYLLNLSARAPGFETLMAAMGDGQVAFMAEAYFSAPELSWGGYSSPGHYSRAIF